METHPNLVSHHGETEIGGFGISAPQDLLLIEDFGTVRQTVSAVSVAFDDEAVADFFDAQVDEGRKPDGVDRHVHAARQADRLERVEATGVVVSVGDQYDRLAALDPLVDQAGRGGQRVEQRGLSVGLLDLQPEEKALPR